VGVRASTYEFDGDSVQPTVKAVGLGIMIQNLAFMGARRGKKGGYSGTEDPDMPTPTLFPAQQ
jgi:hypothetical protein